MLQVPEGEEPPPAPEPVVEEEDEEEEQKEKEVWNAYTTVKGLIVAISGLKEGKRYKFRVAAKNIMGCSSFSETREPSEIKEQIRKSHCSAAVSSFDTYLYFSSFNMLYLYLSLFNSCYLYFSFNTLYSYSGAQDPHG